MRRRLWAVALLAALAVPLGAAQAPVQAPDFKVEIWGDALTDFSARLSAYAELRERLQQGLPPLVVTARPEEILAAEEALAARIRLARAGAKRGEIFAPKIRDAFRRALASVMTLGMCEAIRDDNPGEFSYDVNGTYPKRQPHSTVPPTVLGVLPRLPDDVMYRFLDRDLILHDTRANIILDRIDDATKCPRPPG
jgi:hypothetical protein